MSHRDSIALTENEESLNVDVVDNTDRDLENDDDGEGHIRAKFKSKGSISLATESSKSKKQQSFGSNPKGLGSVEGVKSSKNETIIEEIRG